MKLAAQHHNNAIRRKCWKKWHMVIVEKWRRRVEKACQAKAQEICISLTSDYESKLQSLEEKYNASREEVMSLHKEREYYEENMKKAFMRACALSIWRL
ncbi:POC5 [Bugula neritina]|uniref:Centrosomal protein POC5 n=1 Tax=Bugula neritina TaxID=10212 RepID=A0A7J7JT86_BUGNE|nr:POC5 [Bugula neritina]